MATRAIPREEWRGFFARFSADHRGALATLEMLSVEVGDQTVASEQAFRGVSADEKDGVDAIAIMLGATLDDGTTCAVRAPVEVWLREAEGAIGAALEIRTAEGSIYLIRFVPPTLPAL